MEVLCTKHEFRNRLPSPPKSPLGRILSGFREVKETVEVPIPSLCKTCDYHSHSRLSMVQEDKTGSPGSGFWSVRPDGVSVTWLSVSSLRQHVRINMGEN